MYLSHVVYGSSCWWLRSRSWQMRPQSTLDVLEKLPCGTQHFMTLQPRSVYEMELAPCPYCFILPFYRSNGISKEKWNPGTFASHIREGNFHFSTVVAHLRSQWGKKWYANIHLKHNLSLIPLTNPRQSSVHVSECLQTKGAHWHLDIIYTGGVWNLRLIVRLLV